MKKCRWKKKVQNLNFHLKSCFTPQQMKLCVFSCCGLMRMSRVLQSCKQNPSEDKMPRHPRPSYQQIRFDKKQTWAQALAFRSCCILQHFIKHKVLWKCFSVCVSCELLTHSLFRLLSQCYFGHIFCYKWNVQLIWLIANTTQCHCKLQNPPDNTLAELNGHFTNFTHQIYSLISRSCTLPVKTDV